MPRKRRNRHAMNAIQVFTEDDIADELYGDEPRPPRDPNVPPKMFFSIERPVSKNLYNNTPFGRAVAASYTSDTSTEWETTDEDDDDDDDDDDDEAWQTARQRQGTVNYGETVQYCDCPIDADKNQPKGATAATTSRMDNIALNDRRCDKCMKYKQDGNTQLPESQPNQERGTKKKKYHRCQLMRKFNAYVLDGHSQITPQNNEREGNSSENQPAETFSDEYKERLFYSMVETDELLNML